MTEFVPSQPPRAVHIGHYIEASLVPVLLGGNALIFLDLLLPGESAGLLVAALAGLVAYFGAAALYWPVHGRALCTVCMVGFPLEAPEIAHTQRRSFRIVHTVDDAFGSLHRVLRLARPWQALAMAALLGGVLAGVLTLISPWLALLCLTGGAVVLRAALVHQRFRPWCPWCHPRRDGDHETSEPTPDPVGSHRV